MLVFGGILDVTRELDEMIVYDMELQKWVMLFEEVML